MILRVRNVEKSFGGLKAVDNVSFDVMEKEILGIIGPNGAGKTTLFNCICGVYQPTKGEILFKEKPIHNLPSHEIANLGIARTFQITHLFLDMTVMDNIISAFGLKHYRRIFDYFKNCYTEENIAKAKKLIDLMELNGLEKIKAGNLSLGFMRRLEIARALALEPEILMLDEPCAGLSHNAAEEFIGLIRKLQGRLTIVMVEHNMNVIMNICDRILVLNYGKKIAEGVPEQIQCNKEVIEAYLGREEDAET